MKLYLHFGCYFSYNFTSNVGSHYLFRCPGPSKKSEPCPATKNIVWLPTEWSEIPCRELSCNEETFSYRFNIYINKLFDDVAPSKFSLSFLSLFASYPNNNPSYPPLIPITLYFYPGHVIVNVRETKITDVVVIWICLEFPLVVSLITY